jgi:hypothetical protein
MNNFFNAAAQSATPHFATFLHMQDTDARPVGVGGPSPEGCNGFVLPKL